MHKFLLTCFLIITTHITYADVKAFLNQNIYFEGDPVTLIIESSGKGKTTTNNDARPDLGPLKKDFQILGTSTSTQINILNGIKSIKKTWTIELQPKRKGKYQIPSLKVAQQTTLPVRIEIKDIPDNVEEETKKHVFVESSVDIASDKPYVQQQIPYTVKLFYDASMKNGKIYSPTVENAVVEQLGEDRRYRTIRMGKKYSVVEKHFVISPEKSGILYIPPTTVKGRIAIAGTASNNQKPNRNTMDTDFLNRFFNNSPFDNDPFFKDIRSGFFTQKQVASKPFTAKSEAIKVEVQPLPSEFKGELWLPAEELLIEDSWSSSPPELRVGEPVTRLLRLQVKGLAGSQIPKIDIPKPNNMRIYPEPAKSETRTDGKTVYGISEINISYIPDVDGKISIPEIKLDWWNVISKKQETFTLAKWDLNVATSVVVGNNTSLKDIEMRLNSTPEANPDSKIAKSNPSFTNIPTTNSMLYWILSIIVLMLSSMAYYFFVFLRDQRRQKTTHRTPQQTLNIKKMLFLLKKACLENNPYDASKQLLNIAKASWENDNPPQSLGTLALEVSSGGKTILELQKSLYAKNNAQWNGSELWNEFKNGLQKKTSAHKQESRLKPLYPAL